MSFGEYFPREFSIQSSSDQVNWRDNYVLGSNSSTTLFDLGPTSFNARYVRIYSAATVQGNGVSINELEIYGTGLPAGVGASLREEVEASSFHVDVYPIPTSDVLTVQFNSLVEDEAKMTLSNSVMQTVLDSKAYVKRGENKIPLSTAELPSGIYFLNIKLKDNVILKKVQVVR